MAKNNIIAAKGHLRILGYEHIRNKGYHWYRLPNKPGHAISYLSGKWVAHNPNDKNLTLLLEKLTLKPKRYNNKKLTRCEAMITMAGGKQSKTINFWTLHGINIYYSYELNKWRHSIAIPKQSRIQLIRALNQIMEN